MDKIYKITFTMDDGTKKEIQFTVPQGEPGKNGITPNFKIENGELKVSYDNGSNWSSLGNIKGADGKDGTNGTNGENGKDGLSLFYSTENHPELGEDGIEFDVNLIITNGRTIQNGDFLIIGNCLYRLSVSITNGIVIGSFVVNMRGKDGENGVDGNDGKDGADGVGISKIEKTDTNGKVDTYTITLTNGNTSTFTVTNGTDGADGNDGTSVTVSKVTESTVAGGSNVVTFSDGNTLTVKNGKNGADGNDGEDGKDGEDGHTPVKGTDYFTEADKTEIVKLVLAQFTNVSEVAL